MFPRAWNKFVIFKRQLKKKINYQWKKKIERLLPKSQAKVSPPPLFFYEIEIELKDP